MLMHPSTDVELFAGQRDLPGSGRAVDRVGRQQPAEEHHLGRQEEPHSERGGFALLIHVVELLRQDRRVVVRGASP